MSKFPSIHDSKAWLRGLVKAREDRLEELHDEIEKMDNALIKLFESVDKLKKDLGYDDQ